MMLRPYPTVLLSLAIYAILLMGCRSSRGVDDSEPGTSQRRGFVIELDDVDAAGYTSIDDLLIARAPNVRRAPDGTGIVIRGPRSLQGSNSPLYVVDGVPSTGSGRLSLHDVDEVEVVTDPGALAMYGSRGMHGVILVRTKRPDGQ